MDRRRKLLIALVATLATALVGVVFFWQPAPPRGAVAEAPRGGDFTLRAAAGPVSLKEYRGKVVVLYFGYTYCPDICPTSLSLLGVALSSMGADELRRVVPIFISVDPERDTPERLASYAPFFHPSLIGATGTPEEIAAVAKQYGAAYAKQKVDTAGGYVVDHSSATYVVGPDGHLASTLPHGTPPDQIVAAIRSQLASAGR